MCTHTYTHTTVSLVKFCRQPNFWPEVLLWVNSCIKSLHLLSGKPAASQISDFNDIYTSHCPRGLVLTTVAGANWMDLKKKKSAQPREPSQEHLEKHCKNWHNKRHYITTFYHLYPIIKWYDSNMSFHFIRTKPFSFLFFTKGFISPDQNQHICS